MLNNLLTDRLCAGDFPPAFLECQDPHKPLSIPISLVPVRHAVFQACCLHVCKQGMHSMHEA